MSGSTATYRQYCSSSSRVTVLSTAMWSGLHPVLGCRSALETQLCTVGRARSPSDISKIATVFETVTSARCNRISIFISGRGVDSARGAYNRSPSTISTSGNVGCRSDSSTKRSRPSSETPIADTLVGQPTITPSQKANWSSFRVPIRPKSHITDPSYPLWSQLPRRTCVYKDATGHRHRTEYLFAMYTVEGDRHRFRRFRSRGAYASSLRPGPGGRGTR